MCGDEQEHVVLAAAENTHSITCTDAMQFCCRVTLVIVLSVGFTLAAQKPVQHLSEGSTDQLIRCIRENTDLIPLVYNAFLPRFSRTPCNAAETMNGIQQNGFHFLRADHWSLILPDELFTGVGWPFKVAWTGFKVEVTVLPKFTSSGPLLSNRQLDALENELVKKTRLIPVLSTDESLSREFADIKLNYGVYAYKDAAETTSVVALLYQDGDMDSLARIIFGRLIGEKVELVWDSPLFEINAHSAELGIEDIDGDGYEEIIVRATVERGAHGQGWDTITIFDHRGQEMTRQPSCSWMHGDLQPDPGQICPISGQLVQLHKTSQGPVIEATETPSRGGDAIYLLRNRHFVLARSHIKQLYPPPH